MGENRQCYGALKGQYKIAQGKRSGALGNVAWQRWRPTGAIHKLRHYELRLQRAGVVDYGLPNVPFALLTLRWAMNDLGFQPDFFNQFS